MVAIEKDEIIIFPLAFNKFCTNIDSIADFRRDNTCTTLYRTVDELQLEEIKNIVSKRSDVGYFVLDFDHIDQSGDRIFKNTIGGVPNVILSHISDSMPLMKRIKDDLKDFIYEGSVAAGSKEAYQYYLKHKAEIDDIYHNIDIDIVKGITKTVKEKDLVALKRMESTNVYGNMYTNTAELFCMVMEYRYIVFRMLCNIIEDKSFSKIDAFVSASRIGANIANIIGWLTGKKVIYCTDLGPKYSLSLQYLMDDIRPKKKYGFIFDFMCLGTEAKILNAILTVKGAELSMGFGLAEYNVSSEGFFRNIHALVNVKKDGFCYNVAGEKESLKSMLKEDFNGRLFRFNKEI